MATQAQGIVATSSSKLENLPIFFGDDRDTITALHFADRVASNMVDGSAKWTDLAAFNFVKNALRGPARDWLDEKNEDGEFRGTWSDLKPKFLKRFMSKLTFSTPLMNRKLSNTTIKKIRILLSESTAHILLEPWTLWRETMKKCSKQQNGCLL